MSCTSVRTSDSSAVCVIDQFVTASAMDFRISHCAGDALHPNRDRDGVKFLKHAGGHASSQMRA